ncbi:MAG TPA: M1 family metallopeptidase [Acidimicrobiales bacterium]|nr:M1 family metallopeptidase [Acidimicrobiales bacterium]
MPDDTENPYRLPRSVVPRRYELTLVPDLDAATFAGDEAVAVTVAEPTDEIVLNAVEIEIDDAEVEMSDGTRLVAEVALDAERERATLRLPSAVPAGVATVFLRFRGVLNDKLRGFYRSTFTDEAGIERVLATTQMEATDARRAFPCWDEPEAKAVFAVTLVVPDDLLAISNGAELGREPSGEGRVAVRFADTIPMSTYLVAFVVGRLVATEPVLVDGKPLRVVGPIGKEKLAGYALEVGAFALRYFSEWFGIVYPGDKLDLVAIPDFAFGAMENLGCVTFRERYVLIDPDTATQAEKQAVVDVIAHEIAHMWFGDLVTMKWWNGIWLNEAFATFMEMTCTDAFRPDWQRWVDFGLSRSAAFDTDALVSTRPVEYPVVSPDEADGMFDVLTYEKGASVVRMLEQYLGAERFRQGIRRYMARHQFGNTETSDLWDALEEETGEPVRRIAESWIFQGGFPEVTVSSEDSSGLKFSQRRFAYGEPEGDTLWAVPVVAELGLGGAGPAGVGAGHEVGTTVERVLLDGPSADLELDQPVAWAKANAGAHGFYRVRYAPDLLAALLDRLDALSPLERYTLVDDAWSSVLAGSTGAPLFLDVADGFSSETDLSVWERLLGSLAQLDRLVSGPARAALAARVGGLIGPARRRLGDEVAPGDDDRTRTLRGSLLNAAAVLAEEPAAQARCRGLLDRFLDDPSGVEPSLSAPALGASATLGDVALHERLVAAFTSASNPQDRERILRSLARFRDREALGRTVELSLSGAVRTQDAPYLLGECLANRDNAAQAWAFVAAHWDEINDRFPANSIPRLVGGIRSVRDRALAGEIVAFLTAHPVPQGEMQVRQHLERMWVTVALAEREADALATALTS